MYVNCLVLEGSKIREAKVLKLGVNFFRTVIEGKRVLMMMLVY